MNFGSVISHADYDSENAGLGLACDCIMLLDGYLSVWYLSADPSPLPLQFITAPTIYECKLPCCSDEVEKL